MREKLPTPRWLPTNEMTERDKINGCHDETALTREVALNRFRQLRGSGEMDEAIGHIYGRSREGARIEVRPLSGCQYFVSNGICLHFDEYCEPARYRQAMRFASLARE